MRRKDRRSLGIDSLESRCVLAAGPFDVLNFSGPDSQPDSSSVADLDNDGDLDLVISSLPSGKIMWYENDGHGQFAEAQTLVEQPDIFPGSLAVGDLTGDGRMDIIWSAFQNTFNIYWIRGLETPGTFTERAEIGFGIGPFELADLDNDHDLDIVIAAGVNSLRWMENVDGHGTFASHVIEFGAENQFNSLSNAIVEDIDGDSDMDIVISEGRQIAWLKNGGRTDFTFHWVAQEQLLWIRSVLLVDTNQDGALDIVTEDGLREMTAFEFQRDSGKFGAGRRVITDNRLMLIQSSAFDYDGDSDVDLVIGFESSDGSKELSYFENMGASGYEHRGVIAQGVRSITRLASGDFNGDGLGDVIVLSQDDRQVYLLEGQSNDDRFGALRPLSSPDVGAKQVVVGDLNGDTLPDLILVSPTRTEVSWRQNLGKGRFKAPILLADRLIQITDLALADINGDGDLDVIATSLNGTSWMENVDGQGRFGPLRSIGMAAWEMLLTSDYDLDGDIDVVGYQNVDRGEIRIYENTDGLGRFREQLLTAGSFLDRFPSITLVDMDHDRDLDIAAIQWQRTTSQVVWYENKEGTIDKSRHLVAELSTNSNDADFMDVDSDGDLDFITSSFNHGILFWYEHLPNGSFVQSGRQLPRINQVNSQLDVVDLDQDGDQDILLWGDDCELFCETSGMEWLRNDGKGRFVLEILLPQGSVSGWSPEVSDLDRDGDLDIIAASQKTDDILWFRNQERIVGDVNRDGVFNSSDLTAVFQAGLYEKPGQTSTLFEEGDWNQDGQFTTTDLIYAFQRGGFQASE